MAVWFGRDKVGDRGRKRRLQQNIDPVSSSCLTEGVNYSYAIERVRYSCVK